MAPRRRRSGSRRRAGGAPRPEDRRDRAGGHLDPVKPILIRYVSEVAYRSGLSLSAYGRPHSPECAVNEHRSLVEALAKGDRDAAMRLMAGHLEAVADRAFLPDADRGAKNLVDILAPYVED